MMSLLFGHWQVWSASQVWADRVIFHLPRLVASLAVLLVGFALARMVRGLAVGSFTKAAKDQRAGQAWGTIVQYGLMLLVVVAALAVAGVPLTSLAVVVGALGFGLAFALQDTLANLFAGLIILSSHPFARDDAVNIAGQEGVVERIHIRSTQIKTFDGLRVEVPNKSVLGNPITVFSYNPTRRWDVLVGVGYDDDIPGAVQAVREATLAVEDVLEEPEPQVLVDELGGSSVNLRVRFWTDKEARGGMLHVKSEVTRAVKEALDERGFDIPYPIRTIFMHEEDGGAKNGTGADGGQAEQVST